MPITCTDGTTAESLEECPQLVDYQSDIGYEAEGEFIDDPTTPDIDEGMKDIYEAIGSDWTGQTLEEFTEMYGSDFPAWTGSESEQRSNLIEAKLGMIPELMDLSKRGFDLEAATNRLSATTELEGLREGREAMFRAGGGMETGQSIDKVQSLYDRVLSGFDLQQEGIDIKREASLFDFEGKVLGYEMDLSEVKQEFQDNMWNLISGSLDKYKGPETSVTCADGTTAKSFDECPVITCAEQGLVLCADQQCYETCPDNLDAGPITEEDLENNPTLIVDLAAQEECVNAGGVWDYTLKECSSGDSGQSYCDIWDC